MSESMNLPLDGVRVVDMTIAMLGPSATQVLADYGADVIKIERPQGDVMRSMVPDKAQLDNPIFLSLNRNKRSVALDLKDEQDLETLRDLIRNADVLVSNFRTGVMERLGLGYEDLKADNPELIWATATPYGSEGPMAHKAGIDQLAQAMTGLMSRRADAGSPPAIDPNMVADYTGSMHLAMGILLALMGRHRTDRGQKIEVSLYASAMAVQIMEATEWLTRGTSRNFANMPLNGVYETTDGHVLMMGVFHDNALSDISTALGIEPNLSTRQEFSTPEKLFENIEPLQEIFRRRLSEESTDYWIREFEEVDIKCSPLISLEEALQSEQVAANNMILAAEHPNPNVGTYRTLASPMTLSDSPVEIRLPPPMLGEHTEQVRDEHRQRTAKAR